MKVDIVTSDDIKFDYTGKFQDFTAGYVIKCFYQPQMFFSTYNCVVHEKGKTDKKRI